VSVGGTHSPAPATLPELGIDRHVASQGERLAAAPDVVREYLATEETPTVAGAVRAVTKATHEEMAAKRARAVGPEQAAKEEANRLRVVWRKQLQALSDVISHDPEKYVPLAGPDSTLPGLIAATRKWLDAIERESASLGRLHSVGGDRERHQGDRHRVGPVAVLDERRRAPSPS